MAGTVSPQRDAVRLLRTKLHRPALGGDIAVRDRLLARLDAGRDLPLTLLTAPAGYGKTTLAVQWLARSDRPSAWLSLDPSDSDVHVFLRYIVASLQGLFPEFGRRLSALVKSLHHSPPQELAGALVDALEDVDEPFYLALDDYHSVGSPEVTELMDELLKFPPAMLHVVMLTRQDPRLSLGRLRAKNLISEVRIKDLMFRPDESAAVLERFTGSDLDKPSLERLDEALEGWPAGLRLAALAIGGEDVSSKIESVLGSDIPSVRDFLMDEVLSRQSAAMAERMMRASIVDRFCGSLCDELFEGLPDDSGSDERLSGLEFIELVQNAGLFAVPLDPSSQWIRFHHLFRDLLRSRVAKNLSPDTVTALHRRAARWFEKEGLIEDALQHARLAGDEEIQRSAIASHWREAAEEEQWNRVHRWLEAVPEEVKARDADLLSASAWIADKRGNTQEAFRLVPRIEELLSDDDAPQLDLARADVELIRSYELYLGGDGVGARECAERALELLPNDNYLGRPMAYVFRALSCQLTGDSASGLEIVYEQLRNRPDDARQATSRGLMFLAVALVGWQDANLGEVLRAADAMHRTAEQFELPDTAAWASYLAGLYHYQRNDSSSAEEAFRANADDPLCPNVHRRTMSLLGLVRTLHGSGRVEAARELLGSTVDGALTAGNSFLLSLAQAVEAELNLREGRVAAAMRWAEDFDTSAGLFGWDAFIPHLTVPKALLQGGTADSVARAEEELYRLKELFESTHNRRFLIETLAVLALLHDVKNERSKAVESLARAVSDAQPGNFVRLFADLGPGLVPLLEELRLDAAGTRYVNELLTAFSADSSKPSTPPSPRSEPPIQSALVEPLSPRELDVLALLAERYSNKEIAEQLFIAPETVKRHTINIYGKLGVNGRREAVAKATEVGILSGGAG